MDCFFKIKYFLVELTHSDGSKEYGGFAAGNKEAFWNCTYSSHVRCDTEVKIKEVTKDYFFKTGVSSETGIKLKTGDENSDTV